MTDLELARRIESGDPFAAERMVRDHYAPIYRLLRHLTANREDGEDLTQQVFVKARLNIRRFRGASSLKTWLRKIAVNEYSQWKRQRRKTTPLDIEQPIIESGFGTFIEGEWLLRALAALPAKHRETFILHEVEEWSVAEVAQILTIPAGTVKARLFHARKKLRSLLEDRIEVTPHEPRESTV